MLYYKSGFLGKSRDLHNNALELLEMFGWQKAVQHFITGSQYQGVTNEAWIFSLQPFLVLLKGTKMVFWEISQKLLFIWTDCLINISWQIELQQGML